MKWRRKYECDFSIDFYEKLLRSCIIPSDKGWWCLCLWTLPGDAAVVKQDWSKLLELTLDHLWLRKAALLPVTDSCWKCWTSGVEQFVVWVNTLDPGLELMLVKTIEPGLELLEMFGGWWARSLPGLLDWYDPVELQLSLPCLQACSTFHHHSQVIRKWLYVEIV